MKPFSPGEKVLELREVRTAPRPGRMPLHDVFLSVRRGEIVGVAGVEGNGQSDLAEAIAGMIPLEAGSVRLCGREIGRDSIRRRRQKGIGHVPEDRLKTGVSKSCTISENLILNRYYTPPYSKRGVFSHAKISRFSEELCKSFLVKTPDATYPLSTLSGGNMQKVVFAWEKTPRFE